MTSELFGFSPLFSQVVPPPHPSTNPTMMSKMDEVSLFIPPAECC